jgi:primosomal protein N' (replication factor Y) (superfamily II helicase)
MPSLQSDIAASPTTTPSRWVEVLVDCPGLEGLYTYQIPTGKAPLAESITTIQAGDIVSVPFGNRILGGIVVRLVTQLPPGLSATQVKEVSEVVCTGFFSIDYWDLLLRVAEYYHTPLLQVIRMALPPGVLSKSQRRVRLIAKKHSIEQALPQLNATARQLLELLQASPTSEYTWQFLTRKVRHSQSGMKQLHSLKLVASYIERPKLAKPKQQQAIILTGNPRNLELTSRQKEVLLCLQQHSGEMLWSEFQKIAHTSKGFIDKLASDGYVQIVDREILRRDQTAGIWQENIQHELTTAQAQAISKIEQLLHSPTTVLLHGVTGSGKTEVYLRTIQTVLDQQQSVLMLVPEIGLTPQLTDRFRARFGDRVLVYHSALGDGERYDTWRQMLLPHPQIIIGTRSAIFAPLPNLGLIVLDEEHDGSFKQDQPMPTYHARLVAQWRAELAHCPVVLGSATPALESWLAAKDHPHWHYLSLPDRVTGRDLPTVDVVDMREELKSGNRSIFSQSLQTALANLQPGQEQAILFIHRRGHSTFVNCRACGHTLDCPHCDVSLAYHQHSVDHNHQPLLRCHYCNHLAIQPKRCPICDSPQLKFFGSGTQKVTEELTKSFPQLRCLRFDSDTTRNKGAHRKILTSFAQGEADVLVGTQMLAKGIDLPQVTLVGIVTADGLLNMPDYRSAERTFQVLTQVAGRCGRGEQPGRAILQTYNPDHPTIQAVRGQDYQQFIDKELAARQEWAYPPYGRMVLLRFHSEDAAVVEAVTTRIADLLMANAAHGPYQVLGPTPAVVMRVANRYRWQIMLKYWPETPLQLPDLTTIYDSLGDQVSMSIDVEPLNFL